MNREEFEYTIKTDRNTGEIMFSRGDYSFKQWGVRHEIIDLIEQLQQENKKYKEVIDKAINNYQYWIDYYTRLNSDERIALRLQENIDILKEAE